MNNNGNGNGMEWKLNGTWKRNGTGNEMEMEMR